MRVNFRTSKQPLNIAKAIKKYVRSTGGEAMHFECIELCARMYGYRNWNDLLANIDPDCSPTPDAFASPDELRHRVAQYLHAIQRAGFDYDQAWDVIEGASAGAWLGIGRFIDRSRYRLPIGPAPTTAVA